MAGDVRTGFAGRCRLSDQLGPMLHVRPVRIGRQCPGTALDVLECDRHIAPDIDAHIDRVPASHPLVVDVTEQVQCALPGPVPCDHRIVAQNRGWATIPCDLGEMRHRGPGQHLRGFAIMVAHHQMLLRTRQLVEDFLQPVEVLRLLSEREVAHDPERVLWSDLCPQVLDQYRIHVVRRLERATAMLDDVLVAEMGVGGEPGGRHCSGFRRRNLDSDVYICNIHA